MGGLAIHVTLSTLVADSSDRVLPDHCHHLYSLPLGTRHSLPPSSLLYQPHKEEHVYSDNRSLGRVCVWVCVDVDVDVVMVKLEIPIIIKELKLLEEY